MKEDSYGFISILQLLQNIDDTFPWVKVTASYLTTVSYRDILFCGLKNCKALSVKVNYLSYFLQNSSSMILVIQCFFYKILYVYQYRKIPSLFECIFCKKIYRGLKSSWLYFVFYMVGFLFGILRYFNNNSEKGQFDFSFGSDRKFYYNTVSK